MPTRLTAVNAQGDILYYVEGPIGHSKFFCKYCNKEIGLTQAVSGSIHFSCPPFYNQLEEGLGEATNS